MHRLRCNGGPLPRLGLRSFPSVKTPSQMLKCCRCQNQCHWVRSLYLPPTTLTTRLQPIRSPIGRGRIKVRSYTSHNDTDGILKYNSQTPLRPPARAPCHPCFQTTACPGCRKTAQHTRSFRSGCRIGLTPTAWGRKSSRGRPRPRHTRHTTLLSSRYHTTVIGWCEVVV